MLGPLKDLQIDDPCCTTTCVADSTANEGDHDEQEERRKCRHGARRTSGL